jgi:TonB-linked SusC/RagA family outer membrane protein
MLFFPTEKITAQEVALQATIEMTVTDPAGIPVAGAMVYGQEGAVSARTDEAGKFVITVTVNSDLLIEADGYEQLMVSAEGYTGTQTLVLNRPVPMFDEKDRVSNGFTDFFLGEMADAVSLIRPDEILRYDDISSISEAIAGRLPGLTGGGSLRGLGAPVFIVNGIERDVSFLSINDIDRIVALKDVHSSLFYGNAAANGVVLITTKHGNAMKKEVNVQGSYGLGQPRAIPDYLPSADYMEQYNIALKNDGLPVKYSDETIELYRYGNPYRYPSVDYYSSDFLKKMKPYARALINMSGGNRNATYYSGLTWSHSDDFLNFGAGKSAQTNQFSAVGNVRMRVNSWIQSELNVNGVIDNQKNPLIAGAASTYWSAAANNRPDLFAPLIPIELIDPDNETLQGRKQDIEGKYLAGGTSAILTNAIADVYLAGEYSRIARDIFFNNKIDMDLSAITEGLSLHTNISMDFYSYYFQVLSNAYAVYHPAWNENDSVAGLTKYGEDQRSGVQSAGLSYSRRRLGFHLMFGYNRTFDGIHHVSGALAAYAANYKFSSEIQPAKNVSLGLQLRYRYDNKYTVDFNSATVHSVKLHPDNRTGFSPSLALGWIISSEDFMAGASFVDHLKLRLSAGIMNTDGNLSYYQYDNIYGSSGAMTYYEGQASVAGTVPLSVENKNLFFEKRKDVNVGIDALLFDRSVALDFNWFVNVHSDLISKPQTLYPSYYTLYIPYENYGANRYSGSELGLSWNRKFGSWGVMLGGTLQYVNSEVLERDEIYANDYQYRKGQPVDAVYGLKADGFFADGQEIDQHAALQAFGSVQPGDIRYANLNGDDVVDENDEMMIGRSSPPLSYGLQMRISYRNISLFAMGTGSAGADGFLSGSYYWVQGDAKYSAFMRNHWTEETKDVATYPRLSSLADNNNFRTSTFWKYNSNRFDLVRLQLGYDIPLKEGNKLQMKRLGLYVRASNLLTLSPSRDYLILNVGYEPQCTVYTFGLKASF